MLRQQKEKIINDLAENLSKCAIVIATDYRGVTAKEMVQLRRQLSDQGVQYQVIKNTLARFAAERAGKKELDEFLKGSLAIAIGYGDAVKPAKILSDYIRSAGSVLKVKGAVLGNKLLKAEDVSALAATPPREVLIAKLMAGLQSPLYSLDYVLSAPLRGLIGVLDARRRQVEGG